jgi:aspartyl protease family protein
MLAVSLLMLAGGSAHAVERVVVRGLFANKAVVSIDGRQRLLQVGKRSPEGVLLISADSQSAVLEVNGQRRRYRLGSEVSSSYAPNRTARLHIAPDSRGMYRTVGTINGQTVNFLVDTGASVIAMNTHEARRLGIPYRLTGVRGRVSTASGYAPAWYVTLRQVTVGELRLRNVRAVVLTGSHPPVTLLGMSFLGRINMQSRGRVMLLKQAQ